MKQQVGRFQDTNGRSLGLVARHTGWDRTVYVSGEVDIATANELETVVADAIFDLEGAGDVYLDLYECSFMDSAGLRVVIRAARNVNRVGRELRICRATTPVRRSFELAILDDVPGLSFEDGLPPHAD